ncbi:MAG: acetate kinase [Actinomycetaceae bacterium]|nr:acetate kinase [Actinomycetaceae bacterium]
MAEKNEPRVLVLNSGSSSIKYQLIEPHTGVVVAKGLIEQIGEPEGHAHHVHGKNEKDVYQTIADHTEGMQVFGQLFDEIGPTLHEANIIGVGHRVVQGGKYFDGPAKINDEVYNKIVELCPLAPLHNPPHLKGIDAAKLILPSVPHVAVFDTAFFQKLPDEAATYALDKEIAEKYEVRRYGAHGTSHMFVSQGVSEKLGRNDLKQIVMHLGNGASVSAVVGDKAVETSMGLTPLEGLVMGTRTGDIDPATIFHLMRQGKMSVDDVDTLFNKKSGMKGLCGANDMRTIRAEADKGSKDARLALDIYVHRLLKYVGSYSAVMGGLDALTFTAGIGENDVELRKELCRRLEYMGVKIDEEANAGRGERIISTPDSSVTVLVYPTNEELAIAEQVLQVEGE